MTIINLQVKLTGKYADAFLEVKRRPAMDGMDTNTAAMLEIIRSLPEWKIVNSKDYAGRKKDEPAPEQAAMQ